MTKGLKLPLSWVWLYLFYGRGGYGSHDTLDYYPGYGYTILNKGVCVEIFVVRLRGIEKDRSVPCGRFYGPGGMSKGRLEIPEKGVPVPTIRGAPSINLASLYRDGRGGRWSFVECRSRPHDTPPHSAQPVAASVVLHSQSRLFRAQVTLNVPGLLCGQKRFFLLQLRRRHRETFTTAQTPIGGKSEDTTASKAFTRRTTDGYLYCLASFPFLRVPRIAGNDTLECFEMENSQLK